MAITTPVRFERALLVDGIFCVAAGILIASRAEWLADALAVPSAWSVASAGLVTVVWGVGLVLLARYRATRPVLRLVAVANTAVVAGGLVWLAFGDGQTDAGRAALALLTASVAAFAAWDLWLLRRGR